METKLLSHNTEYEQAVVAALLIDETGEALSLAKAELNSDSFYNSECREIFEAILEVDKNGAPIDIITVSEYFDKHPSERNSIGGYRLTQLAETHISMAHYAFYVRAVIEYAQKREVWALMTKAKEKGPEGIDEILDFLQKGQEKLSRIGHPLPNMRTDLDGGLYEQIIEQEFRGIKTFSDILNYNLNGGLQCGRFLCLTAPAGGGKTTFVLQLLDEIAKNKTPCLFVALEMSKEELLIKSLSRLAKVNSGHIEGHYYQNKGYKNKNHLLEKLTKAIKQYAETIAPWLTIWETDRGTTAAQIENEVKKIQYAYQNRYELKELPTVVVAIDPLHELSTGDKQIDGNAIDKVGTLAGDLKRLARSLNIPVISLSDTTKEGTKLAEKGREMGQTAFRYSYEITHRADVTGEIQIGKDLLEKAFQKGGCLNNLMSNSKEFEFKDEEENKLPKMPFVTYACLKLSKQRSGSRIPAYFIYHQDQNQFKPISFEKYLDYEDMIQENGD